MDAKNLEMTETADAIANLTEALARLSAAVVAKKDELTEGKKFHNAQLEKKETALLLLKESSASVIGKIDGIIGKIDNVLENNGSGNNNN